MNLKLKVEWCLFWAICSDQLRDKVLVPEKFMAKWIVDKGSCSRIFRAFTSRWIVMKKMCLLLQCPLPFRCRLRTYVSFSESLCTVALCIQNNRWILSKQVEGSIFFGIRVKISSNLLQATRNIDFLLQKILVYETAWLSCSRILHSFKIFELSLIRCGLLCFGHV